MIVCVPVHVIDAPGASSLTGIAGMQLNPSSAGESLTDTLCKVDVAFVGRREGVFDDLADLFVLRRFEVVRLGHPELRVLFGFDRVFRGRRFGLFAARAGGVLEGPVVEVFLGDRVRARALDRFARREFATGIGGVQLNPSSAGVSLTVTLCSVVLPSFVAVIVYLTT